MTGDPPYELLIASNRGPASFSFGEDGTLASHRGGGGMVSGLSSALADSGMAERALWICAAMSEADRAAARQAAEHPASAPGEVPVQMLDIPAGTFEQAYNGIANSVLWFVHHLLYDMPSQPRFGARFREQWAGYAAYNEAFARALADRVPDGPAAQPPSPAVVIQDYHLALAPRMLRARRPGARIAHFSHTPWAPSAYFQVLPDDVAVAVLEGMLGADHLGFLSGRWAQAFLECCAAVLGAAVTRDAEGGGAVSYQGRTTAVAVHPLGVDAAGLRERAARDDVRAHQRALATAAQGRQLIVRVDRTELSKNIVRGLEAYRELLTTRPQWQGKVTHLAFAYPSRSAVPEYRAYTQQVIDLAAEVNKEFAAPGWEPVVLEVKDDYPRSLAACALADVMLVNPIRDGMNLVAEEGPVLSERGCALVLSREAGAASLIGRHALLVNPFDVTATAQALHEALSMPAAERRRRSAAIAADASAAAPARWLQAQLDALAAPPRRPLPRVNTRVQGSKSMTAISHPGRIGA